MPHQKIIKERLNFLEVDENTSELLDKLQVLLTSSIDDMLDRLYEQMFAVPELKNLFPNAETAKKERSAQKEHWLDILFSKDFGERHFANAKQIGAAHERIGLSLGWYVNVYCVMLNKFVRLAADHFTDDAIGLTQMVQAINKAVFIDMNCVIDSYLDVKDNATKKVLIEAENFTSEINKHYEVLANDIEALRHSLKKIDHQLQSSTDTCNVVNESLAQLNEQGGADIPEQHHFETASQSGMRLKNEISDSHAAINRAIDETTRLTQQIERTTDNLFTLQNKHKLRYFPSEDDNLYSKLRSFLKPNENQ